MYFFFLILKNPNLNFKGMFKTNFFILVLFHHIHDKMCKSVKYMTNNISKHDRNVHASITGISQSLYSCCVSVHRRQCRSLTPFHHLHDEAVRPVKSCRQILLLPESSASLLSQDEGKLWMDSTLCHSHHRTAQHVS